MYLYLNDENLLSQTVSIHSQHRTGIPVSAVAGWRNLYIYLTGLKNQIQGSCIVKEGAMKFNNRLSIVRDFWKFKFSCHEVMNNE